MAEKIATIGSVSDIFGWPVGIDGDYLIVGALFGMSGPVQCGQAHIFIYTAGAWVLQATLTPADGLDGDEFGAAVAISGDMAIVGSPYHATGPVAAGKVYVYRRSGAAWTLEAELLPSDIGAFNGPYAFGDVVAVNGHSAIIGAQDSRGPGHEQNAGAAYIFTESGGVWSEQQKLAGDALFNAAFGYSVDIDDENDRCAVGQIYDAGSHGKIRIYARAAGVWALEGTFTATANTWFSASIDLRNDLLAVGAPGPQGAFWPDNRYGDVVVYKRVGGSWAEYGTILHTNKNNFGSSVQLYGTTYILISEPGATVDGKANGGVVYLYQDQGSGSYSLVDTLSASDVAASERCGYGYGPTGVAVSESVPRAAMAGGVASTGVEEAYTFDLPALAVALNFRSPLGALYVDELRDLTIGTGLILINCVPEADETDVAHDQLLHLVIASLDNVAVDATVKVYITRSSDQVRRLAYDQAAGGFQAPYNGALSLATAQASPGSGVNDELELQIDCTVSFSSLETVLVEVEASSAAPATLSDSYGFTIEDLTAAHLDEILWLKPRRCRVKWSEPVDQSTDPGGALFVEDCLGSVEILPQSPSTEQGSGGADTVRLGALTPRASWIGYWLNLAGSAYPENHKPRPITAVDAINHTVTVNITGAYGALRADDGNDWDVSSTDRNKSGTLTRPKGSGTLVRQRKIQASVSSYWLTARLSAEGASSPSYSPEKIQCAFCPVPIAASTPTTDELPAGEDPTRYTYIDWHDDVSYGRLYTIHADGVGDAFDNLTADSQLDHQTPWFGAPLNRIKLWSNGLIAAPNRTEDLRKDQLLRKLAVVLQDVLNCLWQRADMLQYIRDPGLCADELVDFLLYEVANPFRFPLTEAQKRLLVSSLPELYKQIGTEQGIEEFLFRLLNIQFEITPYVEGDFWTLGIDRLGLTTMLGPGTARARNSYEILSPVTLTADEERAVTDVAEWADPYNMHLARIVQPGDTPGPGGAYWILGVSTLGVSTMLGGS